MAIWNSFRSILFGGAIGAAARTAIEPQLEPARQEAWRNNPNKVLALELVAALRAQGLLDDADAEDFAQREGFDTDKLAAAVQLALRAPAHGEAQDLRRRKKISHEQLLHSFAKSAIEPQFWEALADLVDERLSPQVVALAIVRGLIADPGILPVAPPTGDGKVERFPVFPVDALAEAQASGFDRDRLSVLAGIAGRPMAPEAAADAFFKGILERVDFERAVSESDVRNEWRDAILENHRFINSVQTAAGLWLRGWKTEEEALAIAAKHGASRETLRNEYLNRGRPAAPGQMATAAARGIDGPLGRPMDLEQFLVGIRESDIRPEWGQMLWESRFLYPPLFQLTRLVQAGAIDADTAADWARKDRYPPEVVDALHAYWSTPQQATASPFVTTAHRSLYNTTRTEYLEGSIGEAEARDAMNIIGIPEPSREAIFLAWDFEASIRRRELTPAQIRTLYRHGRWTKERALEALDAHGYRPTDADDFLEGT